MANPYSEISKELFGGQPAESVEPETVEEAEVEVPDTEPQAELETEEVEAAVDDTEAVEAQLDESQEVEFPEDINGLAEALDVSVETLYGLQMRLGDSGEPITIGQFKDKVAMLDDIEAKREQLETERKEWTQGQEQRALAQQQAMHMPQEWLDAQARVKQIEMAYSDTDWSQMDPGEAALRKQDLSVAREQAIQSAQQISMRIQAEQQQQQQAVLQEYAGRLQAAVPAWNEQKDIELTKFLIDEGIPTDIVQKIPFTPKGEVFVRLMDELKTLRAEKLAANTVAKEVPKKVKLTLKAGKSGAAKSSATKKLDAVINRGKSPTASKKDKQLAIDAEFKKAGLL